MIIGKLTFEDYPETIDTLLNVRESVSNIDGIDLDLPIEEEKREVAQEAVPTFE